MIQEWKTLRGTAIPSAASRLSVALAPDGTRLSLRLRAEDREAAGTVLGLTLPEDVNGVDETSGRIAICLGPDEWYLLLPEGEAEIVAERLQAAMAAPFSLVDVSHREVGITIAGSAATLALASLSALDLEAMPDGSATRTILDKAQAVLVKHDANRYRIEVWQSYADHVWTLLAAVSREITLDV